MDTVLRLTNTPTSDQPSKYACLPYWKMESTALPTASLDCESKSTSTSEGHEPAYEALSYTWGDPDERETIICNDRTLEVTKNCFEALVALSARQRRKVRDQYSSSVERTRPVPPWILALHRSRSLIEPLYEVSYLWIDAICINQQDIPERSGQVSIMGSIFQRAMCTVVHLGPMDESASNIMGAMSQLKVPKLDLYWDSGAPRQYLYDLLSADIPRLVSDWESLFKRPWFTRTWVVQEANLSSQLEVMIGDESFYWDFLALGSRLCEDVDHASRPYGSQRYDRETPNAFAEFWKLPVRGIDQPMEAVFLWDFVNERTHCSMRDSCRPNDAGRPKTPLATISSSTYKCTLEDNMRSATLFVPTGEIFVGPADYASKIFDLLDQTADLHCKDPRDKLFALYSLLKIDLPDLEIDSPDLEINYGKSASDVFADLSWFLISHGVFDTLVWASFRQRPVGLEHSFLGRGLDGGSVREDNATRLIHVCACPRVALVVSWL